MLHKANNDLNPINWNASDGLILAAVYCMKTLALAFKLLVFQNPALLFAVSPANSHLPRGAQIVGTDASLDSYINRALNYDWR